MQRWKSDCDKEGYTERDLNPRPTDFKSDDLTTRPRCLPTSEYNNENLKQEVVFIVFTVFQLDNNNNFICTWIKLNLHYKE